MTGGRVLFLVAVAANLARSLTIRAPNAEITIGQIFVQGSNCSLQTTSQIYQESVVHNPAATIGFQSMSALAPSTIGQYNPRSMSKSDCEVTVDFTFPRGYQLQGSTAITHGFVDYDIGTTGVVTIDMWYPSLAKYLPAGMGSVSPLHSWLNALVAMLKKRCSEADVANTQRKTAHWKHRWHGTVSSRGLE